MCMKVYVRQSSINVKVVDETFGRSCRISSPVMPLINSVQLTLMKQNKRRSAADAR